MKNLNSMFCEKTEKGKNKINAKEASSKIIDGLENNICQNDIGKVKLLRILLRFFPSIAKKIMKKS
mgnify:CR=1 FL=1